jgi:hypothetical protein
LRRTPAFHADNPSSSGGLPSRHAGRSWPSCPNAGFRSSPAPAFDGFHDNRAYA